MVRSSALSAGLTSHGTGTKSFVLFGGNRSSDRVAFHRSSGKGLSSRTPVSNRGPHKTCGDNPSY
jgi:hypothetical protein